MIQASFTHSPTPLDPPPLNPQNLVEKITRNKIQASVYWKERCFGLSAETMIDRAVELRAVGGMYGEPNKPSEFICLILKMLQIQPDFEIVVELIRNEDYKYVRLLGEDLGVGGAGWRPCFGGGEE
jgi:pre-mRNA-splicing factor 38A